MQEHAWIERFGDNILTAEFDLFSSVGFTDRIGYIFFSEFGKSFDRCQLHLIVDGAGVCVECTAEKEGEAEHVVDLVIVVRATGTDNDVITNGFSFRRGDLRVRVGHGKDDRVFGH